MAGDRVCIDFDGAIDGQNFAGGKGEKVNVILGKGAMLKDFEDRLVGLGAGAQTEFDLRFPDDYHAGDIAGKTARFVVNIRTVEEPVLPEVDETFAESFDVEGRRHHQACGNRYARIWNGNCAKASRRRSSARSCKGYWTPNQIPLPKVLIGVEIEQLARQLRFPLDRKDEKTQQLKAHLFEPEARRRVAPWGC